MEEKKEKTVNNILASKEEEKPLGEAIRAVMGGDCTIKAAASGDGDGDGSKGTPSIDINVYSGGIMVVGYYGRVVVDLAGMKASNVTPILYGHNTYDIDGILGQTSKVVADKKLTASGSIMGKSDITDKVLALSKDGYKFQSSMGATPLKTRDVPEGEDVEVNGQTLTGPFVLVVESKLNEISILPLGADGTTSAAIAAEHTKREEHQMKPGESPEKTAEEVRAQAVKEDARIQAVRAIAKDYPEIAATAVKEGWDENKTSLAVKDAIIAAQKNEIEAHKVQTERPGTLGIIAGRGAPSITAKLVEAAVALRCGLNNAEKAYGAETLEAASQIRIHSFTDVVKTCLIAEGKSHDVSRHDTESFLRAAFSTVSLSNVLANVMNKFVLQGYGVVEQTWRLIANIRPVVDFKAHVGVRLIMDNLLQNLSPSGEIKHGTLSDETRSISADTKALMLAITRKDIINDDLGVLSDTPTRLGFAAGRTLNVDFWKEFESDANNRFTTSGKIKNRIAGGGLNSANLTLARALFRKMTDPDGNPMGLDPTILLVSPKNETTADELFVSTNVKGSTDGPDANVFKGRFKPAVSTYLSDDPWYLIAPPLSMPSMEVAFLNGVQTPTVESAQADFNRLGIQMRCYWDYGVKFAERRGIVRSNS